MGSLLAAVREAGRSACPCLQALFKHWDSLAQGPLPALATSSRRPPMQEGFIDKEGTYIEYDRPEEQDAWLGSIEGGPRRAGGAWQTVHW